MQADPFSHAHTPEELETMLARMERASNTFYVLAVQTGCHAFIEFTGLMNEYIKVCRSTMAAGRDFTRSNVHQAGEGLVMQGYEAAYLGEKMACIYAHTFTDPRLRAAFMEAFGK